MSQGRTLEHVAVVSDDQAAAVAGVVPQIEAAIARGEPVLISGDESLREAFAATLGSLRSQATFVDAGSRYSRPVDAIATVARLLQDGDGRPLHSIGKIPVSGGVVDPTWLWYEAAFTDVMAGQPVVATCLYDRGSLTDASVDAVASVHPHTMYDGGAPTAAGFGALPPPSGPSLHAPDRPPNASVADVRRPAAARDLVASMPVPDDVRERAELVVSELVTNAIRHGGGSAALDAWADGDALVLRVRDFGPGVTDPFAALRPPRLLAEGGAGLWICSMESDRIAIDADGVGTAVTAEIRPRRPA